MAASNHVDPKVKIQAVKDYQAGAGSLNMVAAKYGVYRSTLQKWLLNHELFGEAGLYHRTQNQHYPETLKRQVVEAYLSGEISIEAVCRKYHLRSRSQLERWIKVYNGQKEFRSPGGSHKGAMKTMVPYTEKKMAVEHCLAHNKNYGMTAASFGFTYQQIYRWVQRYQAGGLEKLLDERRQSPKDIPAISVENKCLKKKAAELELELAVHQRLQHRKLQRVGATDFSGVRNTVEYQVIQELHEERGWPVRKLCAAVGISRAAYYKWRNRKESQKQLADKGLAHLIFEIYRDQNGIPGYRQMKMILERQHGIKCNLKRVCRLMRILGLRSVCRRKKRRYHKKSPAEYIAENILDRNFKALEQNEKWLTDVTELQYGEGRKAYLSAILDLYGRNIVAFSLSPKNNTALIMETFEQAFQRYPDAKPLLHSDRGAPYTSHVFRKRMRQAGVEQSMSRPGKCLDNAPMEGFWGILKSEMYYLRHFDDYSDLRNAVAAYIDFYNNARYQKRLCSMAPIEFLRFKGKDN